MDNLCDGAPECSFGTALRNGAGGGLAGANAKANMAKSRKAARDAAISINPADCKAEGRSYFLT